MSKRERVVKDVWRVLLVSGSAVLVLVGVMFFSPLALQFNEAIVTRGTASDWEVDSLIKAQRCPEALNMLDSLIAERNEGLPRFPFFDRFLSEEDRYEAIVARNEIYDLQWLRIKVLQASNDVPALRKALKEYSSIIGYNQDAARAMLRQIKEEKHE